MGAIILIGVIVLQLFDKPIPDNLWAVLGSVGTFVMGAHIKAPVSQLYPDPTREKTIVKTVVSGRRADDPVRTIIEAEQPKDGSP